MLKFLTSALVLALLLPPLRSFAQQPEPAGENLLRLEGTDAQTGIHYLKLMLLLKPANPPADAKPESSPRFTIECREQSGHRSLDWLVRFTGSPDFAFTPTAVTLPGSLYPVQYPSEALKMRFEGYKKSQEFKRSWDRLPSGEFHYRNSGMGSPNLDSPRYFMDWLIALPNLRISYTKPPPGEPSELVFPTKPLLDLLKKSTFCQP